jgi:hypothetical protein
VATSYFVYLRIEETEGVGKRNSILPQRFAYDVLKILSFRPLVRDFLPF